LRKRCTGSRKSKQEQERSDRSIKSEREREDEPGKEQNEILGCLQIEFKLEPSEREGERERDDQRPEVMRFKRRDKADRGERIEDGNR
jgi:hypothetical protein